MEYTVSLGVERVALSEEFSVQRAHNGKCLPGPSTIPLSHAYLSSSLSLCHQKHASRLLLPLIFPM